MNFKMPPNKFLEGHKLLIASPFAPSAEDLARLHAEFPGLVIGHYEVAWGAKLLDKVPESEWKDVTILLSGSSLPTIEQAPKLQYVQLVSAGANHILTNPLFVDTDVSFCTANGVHGPQISEWVIATYLAAQHKIPTYLETQRAKKWQRDSEPINDAVKQRVGILGYGSIGRQVARVATALGMDVHAYTLHARDTPESRRDDGYTPPGLGDVEGVFPAKWFSGSSTEDLHAFLGSGLDLLVVATPLTDSTKGLISAPELKVLSAKKAFISNIARGPVINTADLIAALEDGTIRGAALDVTDPEPLPDGHALWSAKNVIITPHVSGGSTKYSERVIAILELNLQRLSQGKDLVNRISRKEGY